MTRLTEAIELIPRWARYTLWIGMILVSATLIDYWISPWLFVLGNTKILSAQVGELIFGIVAFIGGICACFFGAKRVKQAMNAKSFIVITFGVLVIYIGFKFLLLGIGE